MARSRWGRVYAVFLLHGAVLRLLALNSVYAKWANQTSGVHRAALAIAGMGLAAVEDACVCSFMCLSLWLLESVGHALPLLVASHEATPACERTRPPPPLPPRPRHGPPSPLSCSSSLPPSSLPSPRHSLLLKGMGMMRGRAPVLVLVLVRAIRFAVYTSHFLCFNLALGVDLVFVRTRHMRFQWGFVALYLRERARDANGSGALGQLEVAHDEWRLATHSALLSAAVAVAFGYAGATRWLHVSDWDRHLARAIVGVRNTGSRLLLTGNRASQLAQYTRLPRYKTEKSDDDDAHSPVRNDGANEVNGAPRSRTWRPVDALQSLALVLGSTMALMGALLVLALVGTKHAPSIVAMIAWNASLNEPLRLLLGVDCRAHPPLRMHAHLHDLIDTQTENCTFLGEDTLARHTWGFHGELAFDIDASPSPSSSSSSQSILPNVLVLVIESFRQRDSRYLLSSSRGEADAGANVIESLLPGNLSLTPNFDAWAQRGVAFSNMWSSWRTSRSLEQILFGQIPYDSATDSGTTTGATNTPLSGLPQLFRAKGYETLLTTGSRLDYDDWDTFLTSHGVEQTLDGWQLAELASDALGIDWTQGDWMMQFWGFHDDLTFDALAHVLHTRSLAPHGHDRGRRRPWFATHYTISSHVPFDERPDWFYRFRQSDAFPDFSPLYASISDPETRELVRNYAEMRYYTDLALGRFLVTLSAAGILNDTIVVITGDHGQAPEYGAAMPERDQVGAMHIAGAVIAEGRLRHGRGTVIHDTTAQYDWLNTLADIVGVPAQGLLQTGVGRSLKRKPVTESPVVAATTGRAVYSNNPALNLAVVQGSRRFEFLADVPDVVRVFDVVRDPHRVQDLMGTLAQADEEDVLELCNQARVLNAYFRQRWDGHCLIQLHCAAA